MKKSAPASVTLLFRFARWRKLLFGALLPAPAAPVSRLRHPPPSAPVRSGVFAAFLYMFTELLLIVNGFLTSMRDYSEFINYVCFCSCCFVACRYFTMVFRPPLSAPRDMNHTCFVCRLHAFTPDACLFFWLFLKHIIIFRSYLFCPYVHRYLPVDAERFYQSEPWLMQQRMKPCLPSHHHICPSYYYYYY